MKKQTVEKQSSDSEKIENEFDLLSNEEWEEIKTERIPPKEMAKKLVKLLRPNRPDYLYLKQVFKHTRQMLEVNVEKSRKRLPELCRYQEFNHHQMRGISRVPDGFIKGDQFRIGQ